MVVKTEKDWWYGMMRTDYRYGGKSVGSMRWWMVNGDVRLENGMLKWDRRWGIWRFDSGVTVAMSEEEALTVAVATMTTTRRNKRNVTHFMLSWENRMVHFRKVIFSIPIVSFEMTGNLRLVHFGRENLWIFMISLWMCFPPFFSPASNDRIIPAAYMIIMKIMRHGKNGVHSAHYGPEQPRIQT